MDGTSSRGEFALHLPGLLKVLAEHLYSNRQVALRELIQNAGDGCVRRAASRLAPSGYAPRLDIFLDARRKRLVFSDNGAGLTREEIRDYLSTIGRSGTRELKENLALFSPDEAQRLVGHFGFGFLSAFLLASRVEVETRSMQPESESLHWESSGDESYEIAQGAREQVGTTITLHVKSEATYLLDKNVLRETLLRFADFLPFAIHLDGSDEPINRGRAPWQDEEREVADYVAERFGVRPLAIIELGPHREELGHDALEVPLSGFLFVPPGSVASVREYGDASVYIRGMWIRDDEKHLLPSWARFVRGVVECSELQPTASREDVHQDDTFALVKKAIEAQLANALERIAHEAPETWNAIVRGHADVITGWAARDENFFERVVEILPFRTTRGLLTMRDYLELSGGKFYYVTRELGSLQEQLLAEGRGVPVIDASWFGVEGCLRRFAMTRRFEGKSIGLVQMDEGGDDILVPVDDAPFQEVIAYFAQQNVRARVVAFEPESVPALMIYPRDAQFISEARGVLSGDEMPAPLAGLLGDYVEELNVGDDELSGTLHLNARNPLVRSLGKLDARGERTLDALLHVARLFAGKTLSVRDVARAFDGLTGALKELT